MKKNIILLFLSVAGRFAVAQTNEQLQHRWNYEGNEEFGVVTPADSTQLHDYILFSTEGTYEMMWKGSKTTGTWTFSKGAQTISFNNGETKKPMVYNFKEVTPDHLIIEYQTPDLVRTRYRFAIGK